MNEIEKKLYNYAVSVDWDFDSIYKYVRHCNGMGLTKEEYMNLQGDDSSSKADIFIAKYKPKDPVMVTLPIEDYNRLRKLEIKAEIKRLRKEYKLL